jgi:hypothetical protein
VRVRGTARGLRAATVAFAVLALAACGTTSEPAPTPSGSASGTASATSASPSTSSPSPSVTSATPTPTSVVGFGSEPVTGGTVIVGPAQAHLRRVVVGTHTGYDRLVLDFGTDPVPVFTVTPQDTPSFHLDPSDLVVTLLGNSGVRVVLQTTVVTSHADIGDIKPLLPAIREVRPIGDFEAVVSYGVGVAGRALVRVRTLTAPNRLVVDVAWPDPA